jgi:hypothetical protein
MSSLAATNEQISKLLLPSWNRALQSTITTTATNTWFNEVLLKEMQMCFASHQEETAFLKDESRNRLEMKRAYHNINHVFELCELYQKEVLPALKQNNNASLLP